MYLKYGTYAHAPGEANLLNFTIRPRRSARKQALATVVSAQVSGTLKVESGEDQYDLDDKIANLIQALSKDGQDFGLYHDNGTPTQHFMSSSDIYNMTGNQIVHQTFPSSHNGEYSTGRDFAYAVQAEYQSSSSLIIDYQENITHTGTTGPEISWRSNRYHAPTYRVEKFSTYQTITQSGHAVTLGTYLIPPPPILGVPYYLPHMTEITRSSPRRYPQGFEGFRIQWKYVFRSPVVVPAFPTAR